MGMTRMTFANRRMRPTRRILSTERLPVPLLLTVSVRRTSTTLKVTTKTSKTFHHRSEDLKKWNRPSAHHRSPRSAMKARQKNMESHRKCGGSDMSGCSPAL